MTLPGNSIAVGLCLICLGDETTPVPVRKGFVLVEGKYSNGGLNKKTMIGLITIGTAYLIAKTIDKATEYKTPKGKYKNRYK